MSFYHHSASRVFSIFSLLIDFAQQSMSDTEDDVEITNHRQFSGIVHRSTVIRSETKCEDRTFDFSSFVFSTKRRERQRRIEYAIEPEPEASSTSSSTARRFYFLLNLHFVHWRKFWMFFSAISIFFLALVGFWFLLFRLRFGYLVTAIRIIEYKMPKYGVLIGSHRLCNAHCLVHCSAMQLNLMMPCKILRVCSALSMLINAHHWARTARNIYIDKQSRWKFMTSVIALGSDVVRAHSTSSTAHSICFERETLLNLSLGWRILPLPHNNVFTLTIDSAIWWFFSFLRHSLVGILLVSCAKCGPNIIIIIVIVHFIISKCLGSGSSAIAIIIRFISVALEKKKTGTQEQRQLVLYRVKSTGSVCKTYVDVLFCLRSTFKAHSSENK